LTGRTDSTVSLLSTVLAYTDLKLSQEEHRSLLELADSFGTESEKFLEHVVLGAAADSFKPASEQVALMTLHAAKGLEFPCVFIVGCEQGLLPYSLFPDSVADPDEERRLFYVGMTRAKRYLFLSYAGRRYLFGREHRLAKSSFLAPIEQGLLEIERARARTDRPAAAAVQRQLDLF
jgi:DNA helicase-2/ATP-dependent DNA helicase PcrA